MIIQVRVCPNAKKELLKQEGDIFKAYLTAPAVDGKANKALIDLLSRHFAVRKSGIEITKGLKSRIKTITIWGNHSSENPPQR